MKNKKRTVKQNVMALLARSEKARSDDKFLQLLYWKYIDKVDFNNFGGEFLRKGTPSESITRARRVLQEDGLYLPSEEVQEARRERQSRMRSAIKDREVI